MNILVRNSAGKIFFRPDATCDRPDDDLYPQEFIEALSYVPVFFMRICKAGRSISPRFAPRYFDVSGFGLFLYPSGMLDGSPESIACASCIDHTSFLPMPQESKDTMNLLLDSALLCTAEAPAPDETAQAISDASAHLHLRTGDIVAMELSLPQPLCKRPCRHSLTGISRGSTLFDFNIIMNKL